MRTRMPEKLAQFTILTDEKEILEMCKELPRHSEYSNEEVQMYMQYCLGLVQARQQRTLLLNQNEYNSEALQESRKLVAETAKLAQQTKILAFATWLLAIVTIIATWATRG